jgi:hypothetical protein
MSGRSYPPGIPYQNRNPLSSWVTSTKAATSTLSSEGLEKFGKTRFFFLDSLSNFWGLDVQHLSYYTFAWLMSLKCSTATLMFNSQFDQLGDAKIWAWSAVRTSFSELENGHCDIVSLHPSKALAKSFVVFGSNPMRHLCVWHMAICWTWHYYLL